MDAKYGSIFDKLDGSNTKQIERTLLSITAMSFESDSPGVALYYNISKDTLVSNPYPLLESINRLLTLSN